MNDSILVHRLCGLCLSCAPGGEKQGRHTLTGDISRHHISSVLLQEELEVWVYLPPGYSPSDPWRYPTLYLHDGQNVFDVETSAFGVEWGVDETAERLIQEGKIESLIVVAVANTPQRIALYTPFADPLEGGGGGSLYLDFLTEELKPWIDANYLTSPRAQETAVAGSSLGGLSALYLGWTRPDVFGMVAALSPSLWWSERGLITRIAQDQGSTLPWRIYLDMGLEESFADHDEDGVPDLIDDLRALRAVLLSKGYGLNHNLFYREVPGAAHDERSWAGRVADVLSALFPARLRMT